MSGHQADTCAGNAFIIAMPPQNLMCQSTGTSIDVSILDQIVTPADLRDSRDAA